jgi:hypothetical protein
MADLAEAIADRDEAVPDGGWYPPVVTDRESAWFAVHDALPAGWAVGPLTFDQARQLCEVVAMSPTSRPRRTSSTPSCCAVSATTGRSRHD